MVVLLTACTKQDADTILVRPIASPTPTQESREQKMESFLNQLSQDVELNFSQPGPLDFTWRLAGEKMGKMRTLERTDVSGYAIMLTETPRIEKKNNMPIVNVLSNKLINLGFNRNTYNSMAGTVNGSEAFENEEMVCLINWEIIGGIEGYKIEDVPTNVAVICGEIEM